MNARSNIVLQKKRRCRVKCSKPSCLWKRATSSCLEEVDSPSPSILLQDFLCVAFFLSSIGRLIACVFSRSLARMLFDSGLFVYLILVLPSTPVLSRFSSPSLSSTQHFLFLHVRFSDFPSLNEVSCCLLFLSFYPTLGVLSVIIIRARCLRP